VGKKIDIVETDLSLDGASQEMYAKLLAEKMQALMPPRSVNVTVTDQGEIMLQIVHGNDGMIREAFTMNDVKQLVNMLVGAINKAQEINERVKIAVPGVQA
jgi:hypothetical protein